MIDNCYVMWSDKHRKWMGLCDYYPPLCALGDTEDQALENIMTQVMDIEEAIKINFMIEERREEFDCGW